MSMPPGFGAKMEVDRASELDSSDLDELPASPPQPGDEIRVSRPAFFGEGVVQTSTSASSAHASNAASHAQNTTASTKTSSTTANGDAKPKRVRRKKLDDYGNPIVDDKPKEKKTRRPRAPKDPSAAPANASATGPRKKQKTEEKPAVQSSSNSATRQPTVLEAMNGHKTGAFQTPALPTAQNAPSQPQFTVPDSRNGGFLLPTSNPPTPRPVSSGQNYDPIRSTNIEPGQSRAPSTSAYDNGPSSRPSSTSFYGQQRTSSSEYNPQAAVPAPVTGAGQSSDRLSLGPSKPMFTNARASPSIMALLDPPMVKKPSITTEASLSHEQPQPASIQAQHSPSVLHPTPVAPPSKVDEASPNIASNKPTPTSMDGAMDIDCEAPAGTSAPKSSSSGPSAKNNRPTPPPKAQKASASGTGTGLLASSALFGGSSANDSTQRKGVDIDIRIPLNVAGGNVINMAQEIVKKYGHAAINPRAAAHRAALLRVAAEANRLENGSANDEMSLDEVSDNDDSMSANDGPGGFTLDGKPRQRQKKREEYDKEDDFIDDTELAWSEAAAVAKDGFFVYSGPLVPEGTTAKVEASAPTRGRGRGRGRRAAGTTAGTTHASLADAKATGAAATATGTTTTTGRGRGRGSRGGATAATRKPRITKADREAMEKEKQQRERAGVYASGAPMGMSSTSAAMAGPSGYAGGAAPTNASAAQHAGAGSQFSGPTVTTA